MAVYSLVCNIVLKMVLNKIEAVQFLERALATLQNQIPPVASHSHPLASKKVMYKSGNSVENWNVLNGLSFGEYRFYYFTMVTLLELA